MAHPRLVALRRDHVLSAAAGLSPGRIDRWKVVVDRRDFPVRPIVLRAASLVPIDAPNLSSVLVNSHVAARRLLELGFEVLHLRRAPGGSSSWVGVDDAQSVSRIASPGSASAVRSAHPTAVLPTEADFRAGCDEFRRREGRHPMYRVAASHLKRFWGRPEEMADALGVLLLTWNQAFYRYGLYDFEKLQGWLEANLPLIESFRARGIETLCNADEVNVRILFEGMLDVLRISAGKARGRQTPVGAAKALHLLAPEFYPLWDLRIAAAYACKYDRDPAGTYWRFCRRMNDVAGSVRPFVSGDGAVLKAIDEYNYARYTKGWV